MKQINLIKAPTPIDDYKEHMTNNLYIKRDDLTDFALGGNKVRKLEYFLADAIQKKADYIITYGTGQSNHCRLTAAASRKLGLKPLLILSKNDKPLFNGNFFLSNLFEAEIVWTDPDKVPETIEKTLSQLRDNGNNPYFIQGGGHGNLGTHAYKVALDEILEQQEKMNIQFDYIFHASGTGTTQAGLLAGKTLNDSGIEIVGISIARNELRGKKVIKESLTDYFNELNLPYERSNNHVIFDDSYICKGYADIYPEILETIKTVAMESGILLDPVYTGKAYYGMLKYIEKENIRNSNILFIHTGGIPLLFNYADRFQEE